MSDKKTTKLDEALKIVLEAANELSAEKPVAKAPRNANQDIRILVHQRGWVFVGRYEEDRTRDEVRLHDYSVVRRFGTSAGLPELAHKGPLPNTELDKGSGVFRCARATELFTLSCDPVKWDDKL